jgi:hypothetical protein
MMADRRFVLTAEHVAMLREMCVDWDDAEFGAPAVDPKRPYGNSDVLRDLYELLEAGEWDDDRGMPASLTPREWAELATILGRLHAETETALQVVLDTGAFQPGVYTAPAYGGKWQLDPGSVSGEVK